MLWVISHSRSLLTDRTFGFLTSIIRHSTSTSSNITPNEDAERRDRLATTRKMRLLGLQSNQARKALSLYDDYVYRQKKLPDLRMFAIAINCATLAVDLSKGREIHQYIAQHFPHFNDNLMLKQQLRYFYITCNDQLSANKLFDENQKLTLSNSDQMNKTKIK